MAQVTRARDLAAGLCEMFGLDPREVQSLTIFVPTRGMVTIEVRRTVKDAEAHRCKGMLDLYHLEKDVSGWVDEGGSPIDASDQS